MRFSRPLVLLLLVAAAGCEPQRLAPVPVMSMVLTNSGAYEPRQVELTTVEDVVSLSGRAARLVGGARILVDPNDPLLKVNGGNLTDDELEQVFVKDSGMKPRASYVEKDGVLWPADFHTWNMVTTYYNFERAFAYFTDNLFPSEDWLDPRTGQGATVYYFPSLTLLESSDSPLRDNALFFSPVRAFSVLPFENLDALPLAMNSGVITHEFAHRVFNLKAYGGQAYPAPFMYWVSGITATPALNALKSMDEGFADFHAFGASCATLFGCNPRWLSPSVGKDATDQRDFTIGERCMNGPLKNALDSAQIGSFMGQGLEYQVGTIIAASMYAASVGKRQTMERALLAAYDDPDGRKLGLRQLIQANTTGGQNNFTLALALRSVLQHVSDPQLKTDLCNQFIDRLWLTKESLTADAGLEPACPTAASGAGPCQDP